MVPVPVLLVVRVSESLPRLNRTARWPCAAGTGSDQNFRAPKDPAGSVPRPSLWFKATIASAATCRAPSDADTAVEPTTVPRGNERTSRGNPATIFPWADAVAGRGPRMRGAGGWHWQRGRRRAHLREGLLGRRWRGGGLQRILRTAWPHHPLLPCLTVRRPCPAYRWLGRSEYCCLLQPRFPQPRTALPSVVDHGGAPYDRRDANPHDDKNLGVHPLLPARARASTWTTDSDSLGPHRHNLSAG